MSSRFILAAKIGRVERAYDPAWSETEAGIRLADTGAPGRFGHSLVELHLALARVQLRNPFRASPVQIASLCGNLWPD